MLSITNKLYNQVKATLQRPSADKAAGDIEQGTAAAGPAKPQAQPQAFADGQPSADQHEPVSLRQTIIDATAERFHPERLRAPAQRPPVQAPSLRAGCPEHVPVSEEV